MAKSAKPVLKKSTVQGALALLVLLALAAGIGIVQWPVSSDRAEREVREQITTALGKANVLMGPIRLSLLPAPKLVISDLSIVKDEEFLVVSPTAEVSLSATALLTGVFKPNLFRLIDAAFELPPDRLPTNPSETALLAITFINTYASEPIPVAKPEPFNVQIVNGTIKGKTQTSGAGLSALFADLSGEPDGSLSLSGETIWRGQQLSAAFVSDAPDVSAGNSRRMSLDVSSEVGRLKLTGGLNTGLLPQFNGTLTSSVTDVGRLSRALGMKPGIASSLDLAISGASEISSEGFMISNAQVALGKMMFNGALNFKLNEERAKIVATLAAEDINATDALRPYWPKVDDGIGWKQDALDKSILPVFDLDLRISAERADLGIARVNDVALSLMASEGKFDATLASAKIFNGAVKARLALTEAENGLALKLHSNFEKIDSGAALLALMNNRHFEGVSNGSLTVEATGESAEGLMKNLSGTGEFAVENGMLSGINVEGILKKAETRPLSLTGSLGGGNTEFDRIVLKTQISKGAAELLEASLSSPDARVAMTGLVDIGKRQLDIRGEASTPSIKEGQKSLKLPFAITGTFDEPTLKPDIEKMLRGSD
jgi:AsmA protein